MVSKISILVIALLLLESNSSLLESKQNLLESEQTQLESEQTQLESKQTLFESESSVEGKVSKSSLTKHKSSDLYWSDTQDCHIVGDGCPVWNDAYPKCHLGPVQCNGLQCVLRACTYCYAHAFGCSTDLLGGVNGIIHDVAVDDGYHCGNWEGKGSSSFKVHCACGGGCSFHGNYRVYFTKFGDQALQ